MARIKRSKTYQGLQSIPVYKNDTNNEIFNIIEVPEVFPKGKSYFLILGSDELIQGSDLLIEILDKNGEVVYNEIPVYVESSARAISVWVFSGTARGEATITVMGKLRNAPREWQNKYNVKRTIPIVLNPTLVNNQPIRFENLPIVSASVAERAYLYVTESVASYQKYTSAFYQAVGSYNSVDGTYIVNLYTLALPPIAAPTFLNGLVYMDNLTVDGVAFTSSYSASYKLIDAEHFYVDPPPFVYDKLKTEKAKYWVIYDDAGDGKLSSIPKYIYNFDSTYSWSLNYQVTDTGSMTPLTASFGKIDVINLQTFSGKIDSVKVYKKNLTSDTGFVLMGEFPAESSELFVSRSNSIDNFIGQFTSENWIAANWASSSITGGTLIEAAHVKQSDLNIYNSLFLSQSENKAEIFKAYPKNTKMQFYGGAEYTTTLTLVGQPLSQGETAEMNIYVSGSAFNHTILDDQLGKLVANIATKEFMNYGERVFNFVADYTNTGTIVFEIVSGRWNVANVSVQAASDDGFNPDNLQIYIPLDNIKRNEIVNFKLEFLNNRKESASTKIETVLPTLLKNNPVYIELEDNIVTGSISIGSTAKTGLILAGKDAPTIKSVEYRGFENALNTTVGGVLMYSGSPSELTNSVFDPYSGVGFELHTGEMAGPNPGGGSLAFRYDPTAGSYLIITASLYALPGSNVATGSGLWTASLDGTYISRLGDVWITGSLHTTGPFTGSGDTLLGVLRVAKNTYLGDSISDIVEITGSLNITGSQNMVGDVGITGSLTANATSKFNSGLDIIGTSSFQYNASDKSMRIVPTSTESVLLLTKNGDGIIDIRDNGGFGYVGLQSQGSTVTVNGATADVQSGKITLSADTIWLLGQTYPLKLAGTGGVEVTGSADFNKDLNVSGSITRKTKVIGAYHGDFPSSTPTTDIQEGDTYFDSDTTKVYLFAGGFWRAIL